MGSTRRRQKRGSCKGKGDPSLSLCPHSNEISAASGFLSSGTSSLLHDPCEISMHLLYFINYSFLHVLYWYEKKIKIKFPCMSFTPYIQQPCPSIKIGEVKLLMKPFTIGFHCKSFVIFYFNTKERGRVET